MKEEDSFNKAERAEENALIIRAEIQRLYDEFRKKNGGAIISKITISGGKVNLCIRFPESWRPFRGYDTRNS